MVDPMMIRWVFDDDISYEGPYPRWLAEMILGEVGHYGDAVGGDQPRRARLVPLP